MEKKWFNNQSQAQDEMKDVGGLGNKWFNNQIFLGKGGHQQEWKQGGITSSTLQTQGNKLYTTFNNEREMGKTSTTFK